MSSALVRQALEFVDPEESVRGRKKAKSSRPSPGQEHSHPYQNKHKCKKPEKKQKSAEQLAEENIRKLLALSKHTADPKLTNKIVARTVAGKPLADRIAVPPEHGKSILFGDEDACLTAPGDAVR